MTTPPPSRRALVGGALAASAVAVTATADPAYAAGGKKHDGPPLLSKPDRHLVTRFSYGLTPELARDVRKAGGGMEWFESQLKPSSVSDKGAGKVDAWWPELSYSPAKLWRRQITGMQGGWEVMANYQRRALQRRIRTNRPVLEMMAEFWENHLNVPVNGDAQFTYRAAYGDHVREHALGKFSDLLVGAVTHPAMLIYLDQATSTKRHPNENLGRELLECHTVGEGNFTEDHVKASARILTGYTVDMWETWQALYNPEEHWRGTVKVMGFKDSNKKKEGQGLTRRYLEYLAHHPATARRIAQKLAVKFVRDEPSAGLVARLAKVYLKNDTEIAPVLRALVRSREFQRSEGMKVRDPGEDIVATYRVLDIRMDEPRDDDSAVNALLWQAGSIGIYPLAWPRPDGQPIDNATWSTPGRLMSSMSVHYTVSNGWWPTKGAHRPEGKDWLPRVRVRFDDLVDHLSRTLLHVPAGDRLQKACRQATGIKPSEIIDPEHDLVQWGMGRLLTTFLDSPEFMSR
jgi:hypothetical protein